MAVGGDDFDQVINTNLRGTFLTTKYITKLMMKARSGSIVNITSVIGQTGNSGQSNYAASKAGLIGFTKSIAQEYASRNVRLNCVAPGFIATEMTEILTDEQKGKLAKQAYDLALLSQNMLTGADLTNFIKRSVELVG